MSELQQLTTVLLQVCSTVKPRKHAPVTSFATVQVRRTLAYVKPSVKSEEFISHSPGHLTRCAISAKMAANTEKRRIHMTKTDSMGIFGVAWLVVLLAFTVSARYAFLP